MNIQKFMSLLLLCFFTFHFNTSKSFADIPKKEMLSVFDERISTLISESKWREFVKKNPEYFPRLEKVNNEKSTDFSIIVKKENLKLDGQSYTLGIGYRQVEIKAPMEKLLNILSKAELYKHLYGLDADPKVQFTKEENPNIGPDFVMNVFKKIPVLQDQDYSLKYEHHLKGDIWFQRARMLNDKKNFALRDNLKIVEKSKNGVLLRAVNIFYPLKWYVRALGPQMRSIMKTELGKVMKAEKCAAESPLPYNKELAIECYKASQ